MKVDTALEDNANVYELNYPDSLADKLSGNRLNMSFGPYQVTDADVSWTRTKTEAENPKSLFNFSHTTKSKSGNTTTTTEIASGPTSIFGFTRPANTGEPSINKSSKSITYKFKAGQDITWNAHCDHRAEKRVTQYESSNTVEILSSNYTCQYTAENKSAGDESNIEAWTLSADYDGTITMAQKGKPNALIAHSTGGIYVMPDEQPTKFSTRLAGYTWSHIKDGNEKNIAAISVREETPRVWLDKGNSDSINHVLSMANTGLLIYSWEIQL